MSAIKTRVINSLLWCYSERLVSQSIGLVITIVLSRMLTPENYGIIAIVMVFVALADTFSVNGLGSALIQKKEVSKEEYSSAFYFSLVLSIAFCLMLCVLAEPIAAFYSRADLIQVLRVMSLGIPFSAVYGIQEAMATRSMDFRIIFFSSLIGVSISGLVGVGLACQGYGVWSLAAQFIVNKILNTLFIWFGSEWRPAGVFSLECIKNLFSFGIGVLLASLLITVFGNIQDLAIGKKFSAEDLAYSDKGRQFPKIIAVNINSSISKVLFPALSSYQDDLERVRSMTRRSISVSSYVLAPVLVGLIALAEPFVQTILTDKWLPCVPFLRIMCMVYLLQPMQTASVQAYKAMGRSKMYLKIEIIKKTGGLLVLLYTVFLCNSVMAIIYGALITEAFSALINVPVNKRLLHYSFSDQFMDVGRSITMAAFVTVIIRLFISNIGNPFVSLVVACILGLAIYISLSLLFKCSEIIYIREVIREYRSK